MSLLLVLPVVFAVGRRVQHMSVTSLSKDNSSILSVSEGRHDDVSVGKSEAIVSVPITRDVGVATMEGISLGATSGVTTDGSIPEGEIASAIDSEGEITFQGSTFKSAPNHHGGVQSDIELGSQMTTEPGLQMTASSQVTTELSEGENNSEVHTESSQGSNLSLKRSVKLLADNRKASTDGGLNMLDDAQDLITDEDASFAPLMDSLKTIVNKTGIRNKLADQNIGVGQQQFLENLHENLHDGFVQTSAGLSSTERASHHIRLESRSNDENALQSGHHSHVWKSLSSDLDVLIEQTVRARLTKNNKTDEQLVEEWLEPRLKQINEKLEQDMVAQTRLPDIRSGKSDARSSDADIAPKATSLAARTKEFWNPVEAFTTGVNIVVKTVFDWFSENNKHAEELEKVKQRVVRANKALKRNKRLLYEIKDKEKFLLEQRSKQTAKEAEAAQADLNKGLNELQQSVGRTVDSYRSFEDRLKNGHHILGQTRDICIDCLAALKDGENKSEAQLFAEVEVIDIAMKRLQRNLDTGQELTKDGREKTQEALTRLKRAKEDYQRRLAAGEDMLTVQAEYIKTCKDLISRIYGELACEEQMMKEVDAWVALAERDKEKAMVILKQRDARLQELEHEEALSDRAIEDVRSVAKKAQNFVMNMLEDQGICLKAQVDAKSELLSMEDMDRTLRSLHSAGSTPTHKAVIAQVMFRYASHASNVTKLAFNDVKNATEVARDYLQKVEMSEDPMLGLINLKKTRSAAYDAHMHRDKAFLAKSNATLAAESAKIAADGCKDVNNNAAVQKMLEKMFDAKEKIREDTEASAKARVASSRDLHLLDDASAITSGVSSAIKTTRPESEKIQSETEEAWAASRSIQAATRATQQAMGQAHKIIDTILPVADATRNKTILADIAYEHATKWSNLASEKAEAAVTWYEKSDSWADAAENAVKFAEKAARDKGYYDFPLDPVPEGHEVPSKSKNENAAEDGENDKKKKRLSFLRKMLPITLFLFVVVAGLAYMNQDELSEWFGSNDDEEGFDEKPAQ